MDSLNSCASFIILDENEKELFVWIGENCSQVDRAIAQNIGSDITSKEFKQNTSSNHIPVYVEVSVAEI